MTAHPSTPHTPGPTSAGSTVNPGRTVLLCGAQGFIGAALAQQLQAQGFNVVALSRRSVPAINFASMLHAADWLPHLRGVDMVVNAVGSLRGQPGNARHAGAPLAAIHTGAPKALFDACAQAGVRRVLQLSALGVEGNNTDYARTKRAADEHLLALTAQGQLDGLVVRPSIVVGAGGASTQLFLNLAKLPVLVLPAAMRQQRIQPVAVADAACAMVRLLLSPTTGIVPLGGPEPLSMAALIASLRQQGGHAAPRVLTLPRLATTLSARLGDAVPTSPWCSASLELASHDNCCDPAPLARWLGHAPVAPAQLLAAIRAEPGA